MPANNVNWPVPLQRLTPWYPGQFGVPGTDSDRGLRLDSNGCIFWVDPNHVDANDQRDGTNPDAPFATVAAALTHCRAYRGDVIAVMHNAYWTYANRTLGRALPVAENVTVSVPGVRIVGVSSSPLGVPWVPTANNQTLITVTAMDVTLEGFAFWDGVGGYTGCTAISAAWNGPTLYGENLTVRHCYFYALAYGIQLDYTYNVHIEDCRFENIGTVAIHNPSVYGEPDYTTIIDCTFVDNAADINLPSCDYCVIEFNQFLDVTAAITLTSGAHNKIGHNAVQGNPAGANNYINLTGGAANNLVFNNWLGCTIAQYDVTCSDTNSGQWVANHCIDADSTAAPT